MLKCVPGALDTGFKGCLEHLCRAYAPDILPGAASGAAKDDLEAERPDKDRGGAGPGGDDGDDDD